jgi:hypothetical protein
VAYLQPTFGQANTYRQLLERGVDGNLDRLSRPDGAAVEAHATGYSA